MELTEHDLQTIRRALEGDQEAFAALVDRFARLVYAQSFSLLHDRQEAEDVVQDCFLRAYQFRVRLADATRFPQWLLAIARNLARDRLRRPDRWRRDTADTATETVADEQRSPLGVLETLDDLARLDGLVQALPERWREVLLLRYVSGLNCRAIQERLGLSDGALRGVLNRALLTLRRSLR